MNPSFTPPTIRLRVHVPFDTAGASSAGHATVTIRNLEPEQASGGLIVPVTVYETRAVGWEADTAAFIADRMTVHVVPSSLVVGPEYFDDRRTRLAAMA